MGRPKKIIELKDVKTVKELASFGATNVEIAEFLGVSERTVRRNYAEFLTKGRAELKNKLRTKQIRVALKGNVVMLIWLGKQYLGQTDKVDNSLVDNKIEVVIKKVKT